MILPRSDALGPNGFHVSCCVCGARLELHARTFDAARELVLAAGWQERHRKGGAKKSHWACAPCAKPKPSTGVTLTTGHMVKKSG